MKAAGIMGIILLSLFPFYACFKWLQRVWRPRESGRRFLGWLLASFLLIFGYSFALVLLLRLLFPGA